MWFFAKVSRPFRRRTQLVVHIPTPNTAILLWALEEELEELLNSSPNALNKMMLTKTDFNSDSCGFPAHPPEVPIIPDCSFYTFTPSCPSDLVDLALSF